MIEFVAPPIQEPTPAETIPLIAACIIYPDFISPPLTLV